MLETILGGVLISVVSGVVGKYIGERGKVTNSNCLDHREACQQLVLEKLNNLEKKVDSLTKIVNTKLLGI